MEENKNINEEVTVEEPVVDEAPKAEEPVVDEAPKAEEPAADEAPKAEEPAAEETAAEEPTAEEDIKNFADDIVNRLKEMVKEGNVTRIRIRKGDTIILNLPMTVGLIGTALGLVAAPWAVILGTITVIHGKES